MAGIGEFGRKFLSIYFLSGSELIFRNLDTRFFTLFWIEIYLRVGIVLSGFVDGYIARVWYSGWRKGKCLFILVTRLL